jgi:3-dehydroquinate synthase
MKTLYCKGIIKSNYPIYISDKENFEDLVPLLPMTGKKFIVVDQAVISLFPDFMKIFELEDSYIFPINASEDVKTFDKLRELASEIHELKPSRDDSIIAIGGGLVLNLGGMTASLIMRGMPFYYVPTTLTAQIDASLGSKQAVNFKGAKNWMGMYNDPEFCYVNPHFLSTSTKKEINSQAIEGFKLCLATNKELYLQFANNLQHFNSLTYEELHHFVEKMIEAKLPVVEKDLLEENYGMSMLYGHTVGHAIEMLDHTNITHGEAVGLGMLVAAKISNLLGLADDKLITTHNDLLISLDLPNKIPSYISPTSIIELLDYNKKN